MSQPKVLKVTLSFRLRADVPVMIEAIRQAKSLPTPEGALEYAVKHVWEEEVKKE